MTTDFGKLSDIWVKLWITAVFPGVGWGGGSEGVLLFQVWEMAPGLRHILPHPQAGPTLRTALLGYFLKSRRIGIGASSKWNLLMAAPSVQGTFSHQGRVWYGRNQIHDFFFIIQEKVIPF